MLKLHGGTSYKARKMLASIYPLINLKIKAKEMWYYKAQYLTSVLHECFFSIFKLLFIF